MARALPSITGLSYITVISLASTGDNKGAFVNKREREKKVMGRRSLKSLPLLTRSQSIIRYYLSMVVLGDLGREEGWLSTFSWKCSPFLKW